MMEEKRTCSQHAQSTSRSKELRSYASHCTVRPLLIELYLANTRFTVRLVVIENMSSDLETKFKKAVWLVRNGPPEANKSNDEKLKFYSFYKQATEGDVKGEQPWAVQFEARAKWSAWSALKGMSKEEAMQKYIDLVAAGDPNWEAHPALAGYTEASS